MSVVIIGGVAGGATAAARLTRIKRDLKVFLVERSTDVSFAACGLPYHIGGEIKDRSRLSLQTPQSLERTLGIKVLTSTLATKIDRKQKVVEVLSQGQSTKLPYDKLILSTGAAPIVPPLPGINDPRILTLRTLQDMDKINDVIASPRCTRVAVVGSGFIGLEVAEQLVHRGKKVTLIEKLPTVLPQADEEVSRMLHPTLLENGVELLVNDGLSSFASSDLSPDLFVKLSSGKSIPTDLVILAIGVRPETQLAKEASLDMNSRDYIVVNSYMQTSDPSIYAVGDSIETADLVFPHLRATVALGNIANMQARIAADHLALGKTIPYKGSLGTAIVRVFDKVLAITGWNEKRLKAANINYESVIITDNQHAGYYPGALPITLKLLFDPVSGRIFGAQAIGIEGVDKRIDVIATAIQGGLTVEDLSLSQLCYSPPFGSARDVVTTAALSARNVLEKHLYVDHKLVGGTRKIIDVRVPTVAALHPVSDAINVPLIDIPKELKNWDKSVPLMTVCNLGKTSYFASRILQQEGFNVTSLTGGLIVHQDRSNTHLPPKAEAPKEPVSPRANFEVVHLDCSGLSCPGPLIKLKDAAKDLKDNQILEVVATDPGFLADLQAYAKSNGFNIDKLEKKKGVIVGQLTKQLNVTETGTPQRKGATIVVFSGDLDKVLAAFVIANGAAAMGGNVTMFFTFWGLSVLKDPTKTSKTAKSLVEKGMGLMNPSGFDHLQLSNMKFLGLGTKMMKDEMSKKHLPNIQELFEGAKKQGVRMVACTMSMSAMGVHEDELYDGVQLGGVADFLGDAEQTGTNLFI